MMDGLPIIRELTLGYAISLMAVVLVAAVSIAGLVFSGLYGALKPVHPVVSVVGTWLTSSLACRSC